MKLLVLVVLFLVAAPFVRVATREPESRAKYWPNGHLRMVNHVVRDLDGAFVRTGLSQRWYENGVLNRTGLWVDGRREGQWIWFDEAGRRAAECQYTDDRGLYRDLRPDGTTLREGTMQGDLRQGVWREYWPDGRLGTEGTYRDGLRHGKWTAYPKTGDSAPISQNFEHGEPVGGQF